MNKPVYFVLCCGGKAMFASRKMSSMNSFALVLEMANYHDYCVVELNSVPEGAIIL